MQSWKNGRAAEPDDAPTEALKVDIGTSTDALYGLFETIWEEEEVPIDRKEGLLVKLPKKGDLRVCSSYGGSNFYQYQAKC